jgi:uncharacterized lipoprotein YajG
MRALLILGPMLALAACADISIPKVVLDPVTPAQQQCIAVNAVVAVKGVNFKAMSTKEKVAFAGEQVDLIGDVCNVHLTPEVDGWIKTAVLLAGS